MVVPVDAVKFEYTTKKGRKYETWVSACDAERVSKESLSVWSKYFFVQGHCGLHLFIMGERPSHVPDNWVLDHKDWNKYNNTRENLRWVPQGFNNWSKEVKKVNGTDFRGLWKTRHGNWHVKFMNKNVGTFKSDWDAGRAYAKAAIREFGELAATSPILLGDGPGKFSIEEIKKIKEEIESEGDVDVEERDLPKGVYRVRYTNRFKVMYKEKYYGCYDTVAEAEAVYKKLVADDEQLALQEHMAKPIQYDHEGHAIIYLSGDKGKGMVTKVPSSLWHVLTYKNKWTYDGDYATGHWEGKTKKLHAVVFQMLNPEYKASRKVSIDHRDPTKPLDNRKENLRSATRSQQQRNQKKKEGCSSKHRGVFQDKRSGKWIGRVRHDGKRPSVVADTEEEAYRLLCELKIKSGIELD